MEAIKVRNIAIIAKLPLPYYPYYNVRWVGQEGMSCSYILVIVCTVSTVLTLCIVYIINVGPFFISYLYHTKPHKQSVESRVLGQRSVHINEGKIGLRLLAQTCIQGS